MRKLRIPVRHRMIAIRKGPNPNPNPHIFCDGEPTPNLADRLYLRLGAGQPAIFGYRIEIPVPVNRHLRFLIMRKENGQNCCRPKSVQLLKYQSSTARVKVFVVILQTAKVAK